MPPANRAKRPPTPLRDQVLRDARAAKRSLDDIIRPLSSDKYHPALETTQFWEQVWDTAYKLRVRADDLSVLAQRQSRRLREEAHPANQSPTSWELSEPKQEDQ
jgi:hypothetical protein